MRYVTELKWIDTALLEARDSLKGSERFYEASCEKERKYASRLDKLTAFLQPFTDFLDNLDVDTIPDDWDNEDAIEGGKARATIRDTVIFRIDGYCSSVRNQLESARNDKRYCAERIASAKDLLARYPDDYTGEQTLTRDEAIEQLSTLPNIEPGSIGLFDQMGSPYLRWVFTDVVVRPDEPIDYIETPHEAPGLCLGRMEARINLENGDVRIKAMREDGTEPFVWGATRTPHPHVLDNDYPCLGDFAGPFREAVQGKDLNTAATILRLFLDRAIMSDPAGRTWLTGFYNHIKRAFGGTGYAISSFEPVKVVKRGRDSNGEPEYYRARIVECEPGTYEVRFIDDDDEPVVFRTAA